MASDKALAVSVLFIIFNRPDNTQRVFNEIRKARPAKLPAGKVTKVSDGRAEIENRIKEGKNTRRWDKTRCRRFKANQARLHMGVLANNLLHLIRQF